MAPTGSLLCESTSLITRFQVELATQLTSQSTNGSDAAGTPTTSEKGSLLTNENGGRWRLVRKHDKCLDSRGDFSLSNLHNPSAWGAAIDPSRLDVNVLTTQALKIRKFQLLDNNCCAVYLDRKTACEAYFSAASNKCRGEDAAKNCRVRVVGIEGVSSEMWRARCELYAAMLGNLLKHSPAITEDPVQILGRCSLLISCAG
jgi:hypothetical protein